MNEPINPDFPCIIAHQGVSWGRTEKYGRTFETLLDVAEYESIDRPGVRIWLTENGLVIPD